MSNITSTINSIPDTPSYESLANQVAALTQANMILRDEHFRSLKKIDVFQEQIRDFEDEGVRTDKLLSRAYIVFTSQVTEDFVVALVNDIAAELKVPEHQQVHVKPAQ